jgi:cytochrome bd ubiquinol oxidase subunit II
VGVLSLVLLTMHGAIYLAMKSEGGLQTRVAKLILPLWGIVLILYVVATIATIFVSPFLAAGMMSNPLCWVLILLFLVSTILVPGRAHTGSYGKAFIASSVMIASMIGLSALSLFPRLVPSITDLAYSLTVYNASSSPATLMTMLVIALIGMPLVIIYTVVIYRAFKGKVTITPESY